MLIFFNIVGPQYPIANKDNFEFKSHILRLLSENIAGFRRNIIENTWLNVLEIVLLLTLNLNKR